MDYHLQEGSFTLPEGFQDRTVNMFVFGNTVPGPLSITLSRDAHLPGEDLSAYLKRQLKLLASKLRGYTVLEQKTVSLSASQPIPGVQIEAYYLNDKRSIYQRQAAFIIGPGRVLVFACTSQADFTAEQNRNWSDVLASFEPRNVTPAPTADSEQE
ncbi:DcrB-related protein [Pseudomonas silesiensis]|uniref:DcrB-related protein n=1 Tax=Pseudomonas silesiensis TaxID=1853130 RepID=UPI0034D73687